MDTSEDSILIDDSHQFQYGILANGAAIHSANLSAGRTSYLDTLPQIKTALTFDGMPRWVPLLTDEHNYVDGGKTWRRSPPLSGMHVSAGRSELDIVLWHEEFPTVRKVSPRFKDPVDSDLPVELDVSIEPAQGNAHVDVTPRNEKSGVRRIAVVWKNMKDEGLSPDDWITSQPTAFPPLMPRAASESQWRIARRMIEAFLSSEVKT
ncbi:MAG: hypothetical protein ACK58T_36995, partial [Phycisphaerae bacterium]